MALTDAERAFMESGRQAGYSDDELVAKVKERRATSAPSYKLTDYAGEASKLPSHAADYQASIDSLTARGLSPSQAAESLQHTLNLGSRSRAERERDTNPSDPQTAMILSGVLGAGAGALVGGAARPILAGAANGATQSLVTGGDLKDIALGAGTGALLPAIGRAAKAVTDSRGGQARALWEKHGGNVGPLDSGSGVQELDGMEPTRRSLGEAERVAAGNVRQELDRQFAAGPQAKASEAYGRAELQGDNLVDASPLRGKVADVLYNERTPTNVRGYLKAELDRLDGMRSPDGRVMVTERQLNDIRGRLSDMGDYGIQTGSGSIRDRSFKQVARAAKDLVDEGPYAEGNAIYAEGKQGQVADRQLMGLPGKVRKNAALDEKQIAQWIGNRGNDSEAAGRMYPPGSHEAFLARHPEMERQLDLPDLLRAKETLSFGQHGALDNLIQATARGGHGITSRLGHMALDNANAALGRFAYAPASATARVAGDENLNILIRALQESRALEQRRADALRQENTP